MIQKHGGNVEQFANVLDFSANINPLGMPSSVSSALRESICDIGKYPDPYCTELRDKLSEAERISAENIVCGNGADDLIFRIIHALRPEKAMIYAPSFSEYKRALSETGCEICEHTLLEETGFAVTKALPDALDDTFDMCIVCTPNNPTGQVIAPEVMGALAEKCLKCGIILVCDECFLGFVQESDRLSLRNFFNPNCIILKAFTKLYAMPGIRLGYAVCGDRDTADKIQQSGQFWSVSGPAQKAGIAALAETGHVRRTLNYLKTEREFLTAELRRIGIKYYEPSANFIFFRGTDGLCEKMLAQSILIRDCSDYSGLSGHFFRIAIRTHEEDLILTDALRRCMNG